MKFVCDNCSTQYLISDEKVAGKGVKVRCKRCGNVIVVRPHDPDQAVTDPAIDERAGMDESPFEQDGDDRDDVGQAFDDLLAGGLSDGEGDDEDDGGEQATEIFRMDELQGGGKGDRDKIDQVFAGAESTSVATDNSGQDADRSDWYVAIGDEQVGPLSLAEVEARWTDGQLDAKTLAWRPGMGNWTPLADIAQLRYLIGSRVQDERETTEVDNPDAAGVQAAAEPAGSAGAAEEDEWAPYKGSELASLVEEEMAIVQDSVPPSAEDDPDGDPLGLSPAGGEDGEPAPWEQDEPASGEVAQPSDNFFDSSLDKSSGDDDGYFNSTYSRSGRVLAGPAYLGGAKKSTNKNKWILIGVLGGVVLAGGALAAIMLTSEPDPKPSDPIDPIRPPKVDGPVSPGDNRPEGAKGDKGEQGDKGSPKGEADKGSEGDQGEKGEQGDKGDKGDKGGKGGKDDKGDKGEGSLVVAPPSADKKPAGSGDSTTSRKKKRHRKVVKAATRPVKPVEKPGKSDPPPSGAGDANLPEKLSKAQISKTMKGYIKSMKACVEQQLQRDPSVTGTMKVSFTIQPSGKVAGITVKTPEHKGTYVAGCISFIIKSMTFPKAQKPFTVPVLPLKLGG